MPVPAVYSLSGEALAQPVALEFLAVTNH